MYFRLLSFTWRRNIKIFDICINNTRSNGDLRPVERQISSVLYCQAPPCPLSFRTDTPTYHAWNWANFKRHHMPPPRRWEMVEICNAGSKTKPWNFCPPAGVRSGAWGMESAECGVGVRWLRANKICVDSGWISARNEGRPTVVVACLKSTTGSLNKQIHKQTRAQSEGVCVEPVLIPW